MVTKASLSLNVSCVPRDKSCTISEIELSNNTELNHLEISINGSTTEEIDRLILATKMGHPAFASIPKLPKFPNLEMLMIKSGLKGLSSNDWRYSARLNGLYLFNLHLIKLFPNTFKGLNELQVLALSLSSVEIILRDAFTGLNNLTLLDLSQNHIYLMEDGALALPKLKKLDLHNNRLTTLSESVFCKLPQLKDIDLSYNTLTHIGRSLECPQNLKKVSLIKNIIRDLDLVEIAMLPRLEHLDLTGSGFSFTSSSHQRPPIVVENSSLVTLDVFGTDLNNPSHFEQLSAFYNLKHLIMGDTPFSHFNYTGEIVRKFLPNLYTIRVVPVYPVDLKKLEKLKLILSAQNIQVENVTIRDYVIVFPENEIRDEY